MKNYKYLLQNLDCANCAKKIEDAIASKEEYKDVIVNFSTLTLTFKTDKEEGVEEEIKSIVKSIEPDTTVISNNKEKTEKVQRNNKDIIRLILGVLIFIIGTKVFDNNTVHIISTIVSAVVLLYKTAIKAFNQVFKNKVLDENSLIVISVIGACLVGKTSEGIMVIALYEIGKILEAKAVNKTRKSIASLMDIKPEYANIKIGDEIKKVDPNDVNIGDTIIVKTGEKIPLDGQIIKGNAQINNSALTGESKLIEVKENDKVLSGGINTNGLLEVRVEKNYENSTVSQILNLVENATDKKAKTETTVSRLAKIYTPIVFALALIVAIFMPLLIKSVSYSQSIYKALTFLVISCPCSIAISVPLSYFSGIGRASKSGVLIKGSDYLDALKDVKEIVFDKTGTITTGEFIVNKVISFDPKYSEDDIINLFAIGESFSNHPIAKSILKKANSEIDTKNVKEYKEVAGKGLEYILEGKNIKIGNKEFAGNKESQEDNIGTNLYLSINNSTVGSIVLTDEIKNDANKAIKELVKMGIKTKMFTGDSKEIALKIAKDVGIDEVKYELLPQDKYKMLEADLQNKRPEDKLVFVGDGINDSPVIARADIGISMGGIGSSSAIEASDIVIMTDELYKIIDGIKISKKTNRVIKENLIFAIGVKVLVLTLSVLGVATMWQAVFADVGTTLITILNTIRILKK